MTPKPDAVAAAREQLLTSIQRHNRDDPASARHPLMRLRGLGLVDAFEAAIRAECADTNDKAAYNAGYDFCRLMHEKRERALLRAMDRAIAMLKDPGLLVTAPGLRWVPAPHAERVLGVLQRAQRRAREGKVTR